MGKVTSGNKGVTLRRRGDAKVPHQRVEVFVDGARVGVWFGGGYNDEVRWSDVYFMIPVGTGHAQSSELAIELVVLGLPTDEERIHPRQLEEVGWTDFHY